MRRVLIITGIAAALALAAAPAVLAASADISPNTQTHNHGIASNWTATWSGTPNYDVFIWYDNTKSYNISIINTSATSRGFSHAFWPCHDTTFTQEVDVYRHTTGALEALATSTATEKGGSPC
jgi:hypothetical protein